MGGVIIRANTASVYQESVRAYIAKYPKRPLPINFQPDKNILLSNSLPVIALFGIINVGVLFFAILGGYILAGRTLRPIKDMVDEQNRFVADASHELKTPLTALRTSLEVNLRDKTVVDKEIKNLLEKNLNQVIKLQSLTDNLLLLAQYEKGKKHILKEVHLKQIIEDAYAQIESLAQNKHIQYKIEIKDELIRGEKELLTQLFIILFDNAIKYSPENTQVKVTSDITKSTIIIKVTDQGIGMFEEDKKHIFDRFYQADTARTKEKTDGYGLGLSIAQKIIEIHKGQINVESSVNKGSTFSILFKKIK